MIFIPRVVAICFLTYVFDCSRFAQNPRASVIHSFELFKAVYPVSVHDIRFFGGRRVGVRLDVVW